MGYLSYAISTSSSSSSVITSRNPQYQQRQQQARQRFLFSRWSSGLAPFSGGTSCPRIRSTFSGHSLHLPASLWVSARRSRKPAPVTMMSKPVIQFIQGTDEQSVPDVKLSKSRDGTSGLAIFSFDQPSVFDSSRELGDITGLYMIDEEGVLQSVDVSAKFVNGKPSRIEAKYIMRNPQEWDRFMRFMERYSNENGLQFIKK